MIYEQHLLAYEMSQKCAARANSLTPVTGPTEHSKMRHFPLTSWSFPVWQWRLRQDDFAPFVEQEMAGFKPVLWVISPVQLYVLQLAERGTGAAQGGDCSPFRSVRNLSYTRDPEPPLPCSQENAHWRQSWRIVLKKLQRCGHFHGYILTCNFVTITSNRS